MKNISIPLKFLIFLLLLLTFSSCRNNSKRVKIVKIISEWTEKDIMFPMEEIECMKLDSITSCPEIHAENYKVLLYVDSLGCTGCRLMLPEWKKIINESDTIFKKKPDFLFFFQPKLNGIEELKSLLRNSHFDYPVFIDKANSIMKLNNFPKEPKYQCFLLDKNNKVVFIGNPVYNRAIWESYKKIINGKPL